MTFLSKSQGASCLFFFLFFAFFFVVIECVKLQQIYAYQVWLSLPCSALALALSGRPTSAVYGYLGAGTKFFFNDLAKSGGNEDASIKNAYLQSLVAAAAEAQPADSCVAAPYRCRQPSPVSPALSGLGQGYETNSKSNPRQPVCKVKMAPRKCRARN